MTRIPRRTVLRGAGLGVAGALLAPMAGCAVPGRGVQAAATPARRTGATRGLVGCTVPLLALRPGSYYAGDTQDAGDAAWEAAVGRPMSVTKKYNNTSVFPTDLTVNDIDGYIRRGVKVCISFKPAFAQLSAADRSALDATLSRYRSAGLSAEICLWQEPGNRKNGMSAQAYRAMYEYYGPTVRRHYPLVANLNYADRTVSRFTDYANGVTKLVDKFAIDYYYDEYEVNIYLEDASAVADRAGLPFGIWECSTAGPDGGAPTRAAGTAYLSYLLSFMQARLGGGKDNADVIWYDGDGATTMPNGQPGPILSPSDYRAPLFQTIWDTLSAASRGAHG